jgi:hypothetical protein
MLLRFTHFNHRYWLQSYLGLNTRASQPAITGLKFHENLRQVTIQK